jgi:hypothetical protein
MPDETYGWITLTEANTYMTTRLGSSAYWTESASKSAALATAYNQIVASGIYSFPETATQAMKNAQCEMALFLLQHQADIDARIGLQAQGVTQAGIVQESYDPKNVDVIPIPPIVKAMLKTYEGRSPIHVIDLERDEEEDAL